MTENLKSGKMQIHKFPLGFIVTQIVEIHGERILHVVLLSGERFKEWMEREFHVLLDFCKEHKCSAIEAHCRPGLAKVLKTLGFRTIKRIIRREIE